MGVLIKALMHIFKVTQSRTFNGNPLSHTLDTQFDYIKINDDIASEFTINAYTSAYYNVPVPFLSGDEMLCEHAKN